jgi:hypothetical protein
MYFLAAKAGHQVLAAPTMPALAKGARRHRATTARLTEITTKVRPALLDAAALPTGPHHSPARDLER